MNFSYSQITRPELQGAPQDYYNEEITEIYQRNQRTQDIQQQMSERCIELLGMNDNEPKIALDIAAGTGVSSQALLDHGFITFSLDISQAMLSKNPSDHRYLSDMGDSLPFQEGTFDAVVSVSGLQWLCYSNSNQESPYHRLVNLFSQVYTVLKQKSKAVFQFYPSSAEQLQLIQDAASHAGFNKNCHLIIDNPNSTKAKKFYLVLEGGITAKCPGLAGDKLYENNKQNKQESQIKKRKIQRINKKGQKETRREQIIEYRLKQLKQGNDVKPLTKNTGKMHRKRNL